MTTFAYCWAGGQIEFGKSVPQGAIAIARGREKVVRDVMCAVSRHAYDGVTLLVPGIPEAPDQTAGADALRAFMDWIGSRKRPGFKVL